MMKNYEILQNNYEELASTHSELLLRHVSTIAECNGNYQTHHLPNYEIECLHLYTHNYNQLNEFLCIYI